jgi:hypothetical protein
MQTTPFDRMELESSMVLPVYRNGKDVRHWSLSTGVLRIWACQPIGPEVRGWQSLWREAPRAVRATCGNTTRPQNGLEHEAL